MMRLPSLRKWLSATALATRVAWLALAFCTCPSVTASQSVAYNAGLGLRIVADPAGAPLADGNEVRVGCFARNFDPVAHADDLPALQNAWIEFDRSRIRTIFDVSGAFAGLATHDVPALAGQRIYLWVFQTYDNGPVAAGFGNVAACGLYTATAPNWLMPVATALPPANSTALLSSEVNLAPRGGLAASHGDFLVWRFSG